MSALKPVPFEPEWPELDRRFLEPVLLPPPTLPLTEVFGRRWARWITEAAAAKSAPVDYVAIGLLTVAGSVLGNARWVSPWNGWREPPIIWSMMIGDPSSGKSPALDAVIAPLRELEREMREEAQEKLGLWLEAEAVAKIAESAWKEDTKAALKNGSEPPTRPEAAMLAPKPHMPLLMVSDTTVERLAVRLAEQPRGILNCRDELSGWLLGMTRYSGGGTDRPFWLETYGGRPFNVERMGRESVYVDRASVWVVGGIQPDRLKSLLLEQDDDGLVARFLPVWPEKAPITIPEAVPDEEFVLSSLKWLLERQMITDDTGPQKPLVVPLSETAKLMLNNFRQSCRGWEEPSEGLLKSFCGKLPGLAVRLALIISYLDGAAIDQLEPGEISEDVLERAITFISVYIRPMAARSYGAAALPKRDLLARRLLNHLKLNDISKFSARELQRVGMPGMTTSSELNPVLKLLEEGDVVRKIETPSSPKGGRKQHLYITNPAVFEGRK